MYLILGRFRVPKILTLTRLSAKLLMKNNVLYLPENKKSLLYQWLCT